MNREIKFRIFTTDEGMIYDNIDCFISINSNGSINNSGIPTHNVMQYTGLKDKNGKEIYEGDILTNSVGLIGIVVFFEGSFCWKYINKHNREFLTILNKGVLLNKIIVGNIYENKDLLNK